MNSFLQTVQSSLPSAKCCCTRNLFLKILVISSNSNRRFNISMKIYQLYFLSMESSLAAVRLLNFTMQGPLLDQVLHQPALYKDRHYWQCCHKLYYKRTKGISPCYYHNTHLFHKVFSLKCSWNDLSIKSKVLKCSQTESIKEQQTWLN